MTLKQLEDLITIDEDITDDQYGTYYDKRTVEQLLNYGLILLDKPAGPTSHEVVAWTKRILEISKAGHSGTLDPQVTGVLPLGLGEGTKALGVLLLGPKEYHALGRLHSTASPDEIHDRRMKDTTRNRDPVSIEDIKKELAVQDAMLSSCSVLSGSPMKVVFNHEGKVDEAAKSVLDAIGL